MMRYGRSVLSVMLVAAFVVLAAARIAHAQPPITNTEVERLTETFSEEFLCTDEIYNVVADVHIVEHFTAAGIDNGGNFILPLHFQFHVRGEVVAVPLDGSGPTFTGHFRSSDSENIRAVKQGEVFVETDTDHNKVQLTGSDGSSVILQEHHHFTVNANGEMTVLFAKATASC
jgi:hypothetical protein